ncbi:MAG: hypothetical protein O7B81_03175, partial [Gammaproteobacteria bacterium]|nr:hypothetical protein [Gammaproteobacteria bacterium]
TQPFEEVCDQADLLLYDKSSTTTWSVGLMTKKPIVLVDFGFAPLPPEIEALLDRRCARVPGWFDHANRAQIDWDTLLAAIERAPGLSDTSFVRDVLGARPTAA